MKTIKNSRISLWAHLSAVHNIVHPIETTYDDLSMDHDWEHRHSESTSQTWNYDHDDSDVSFTYSELGAAIVNSSSLLDEDYEEIVNSNSESIDDLEELLNSVEEKAKTDNKNSMLSYIINYDHDKKEQENG